MSSDALRRQQMADLVRRLEISEAHNEALVADLCDREAADSQTHTSLASHVAELTVAEADVAELQCGRKDWDRERREMSEEIYALRCEKMMHRSELKEVRRAERRKLVAELRCNAETLTKPPHGPTAMLGDVSGATGSKRRSNTCCERTSGCAPGSAAPLAMAHCRTA